MCGRIAIAALLVSMLLLAQTGGDRAAARYYIFGVAPTILVAMIMTIAYDQRFAVGVATLHAVLVTLATGSGAWLFPDLVVGRADLLPVAR